MSGSNNLPKMAQTNRENELQPLKFRGVPFRSLDPVFVSLAPGQGAQAGNNFVNLTPDQVTRNLTVVDGTVPLDPGNPNGGFLNFPTSQSVVSNPSSNSLLQNYFNTPGTVWDVVITNLSTKTVSCLFTQGTYNYCAYQLNGSVVVSSNTQQVTLPPNSVKRLTFQIAPNNLILVYY